MSGMFDVNFFKKTLPGIFLLFLYIYQLAGDRYMEDSSPFKKALDISTNRIVSACVKCGKKLLALKALLRHHR